ncbi:TetR/AcrR family transcriptional regulator [Caldimonas brevitalea]|uniref:Transcriptional regulator, TetR family n=1 Tax=Caldimonas brevitalea TaxID=413882 RepID=A0A0G3BID7_9BURK|nr:TetR/AcrR family transcriptional regulator [Caldimonas brevitalea]AKJ29127.1 transcriptional regulator, TetR family [Caldimonas brevitalea]
MTVPTKTRRRTAAHAVLPRDDTDTATSPTVGRAYGGLAPQDRVAARRARFIEAGVELFGTQGFRNTTVRGLCAAARLTDRYFYESFDSLEALLMAVYRTLMAQLRERLIGVAMPAEPASGTPGDLEPRAMAGYDIWFDMVRDRRFARIVLHEVLGVSAEVDALYEECTREFAELTVAPLQAALPRLHLSAERRALLGRALVGAAVQVATMWVISEYRQPQREVVRTCVLVMMGTLGALEGEAGQGPRPA